MSEKEAKSTNLHEQSVDAEQFGEIAHERHEAMRSELERAERKHKSRHSEREVLAKAQELAEMVEEANKDRHPASTTEKRRGPIKKKQLDASFKSQMTNVHHELSATGRLTSKIIHAKPVEKTSDFVSSTLTRPNAMLSGSIAAFLGITILYFVSKYFGFRLSGSETIVAFAIGWILGILYDYFSVMVRGGSK